MSDVAGIGRPRRYYSKLGGGFKLIIDNQDLNLVCKKYFRFREMHVYVDVTPSEEPVQEEIVHEGAELAGEGTVEEPVHEGAELAGEGIVEEPVHEGAELGGEGDVQDTVGAEGDGGYVGLNVGLGLNDGRDDGDSDSDEDSEYMVEDLCDESDDAELFERYVEYVDEEAEYGGEGDVQGAVDQIGSMVEGGTEGVSEGWSSDDDLVEVEGEVDMNLLSDVEGELDESAPLFNPLEIYRPELKLGMVFSNKQEFKKAVQSHAINCKRSIKFTKMTKLGCMGCVPIRNVSGRYML